MPELLFVAEIAQSYYTFDVQTIEPLEAYCTEWRGLYRLQTAQGDAWMMRMWRGDSMREQLLGVAHLLEWLRERDFPGILIRKNNVEEFITNADGWTVVVLAYVDGEVLGTEPAGLDLLAQLAGRLHAIPLHAFSPSGLYPARCHPERIDVAVKQLARNLHKLPAAFQALGADLHTAMLALSQEPIHLSIVHGDCWYQNAVWTRTGDVVLIDWDLAGIGSPLLELGNLLLTSHFDFERPLVVEADEAKVQAIMLGYQQHFPIEGSNRETLANAMRFLLAYQLGSYIADETRYQHPEFPFVLQKLQMRYDATREIAKIAEDYLSRQDGLN